jgi:Flp pilus assembly secretin CpaC
MAMARPKPLGPVILMALAGTVTGLMGLVRPAQAEALIVPLDHSIHLRVAGTASSVVVGNPSVADVTVVDSHTLFVSGRGYGVTDVVVLDGTGRTLFSREVIVGVAPTGRVSVWRGPTRVDMACAPNCQPSIRSGGASTSAATDTAPAAAAASTGSPE